MVQVNLNIVSLLKYKETLLFTSPSIRNLQPSCCFSYLTENTPLMHLDFFMLTPLVPMVSPIKSKGTMNVSVKNGYKKKSIDA